MHCLQVVEKQTLIPIHAIDSLLYRHSVLYAFACSDLTIP